MLKKFPMLFFTILFLIIALLFSTLARLYLEPRAALEVGGTAMQSPVIVLDAGHGGIDGGATGADGSVEKELNLAIAKKLAALLRMMGYTVIETRTEDISLADADAKKGHVKQSDLENRLRILNENSGSILVSIHMNTYPGVACRGLQVWYSQNDARSAELASEVQGGVKALLQPENNRKIKAATSSIYLLRHAQDPAILIECGFISNPEECESLSRDGYQKQLSLAIAASLHKKIQNGSCENS